MRGGEWVASVPQFHVFESFVQKADMFANCTFGPNGMTNATFIGADGKTHFASHFLYGDLILNNVVKTGLPRFPFNLILEAEQNLRAAAHPVDRTVNALVNTSVGRQSHAYLIDASIGQTKNKNDFQVGYAFVRQEQRRWDEAMRLSCASLELEPAAGHSVHARTHVHYETGEALPDLARWSAETGVAFTPGVAWETLARGQPVPRAGQPDDVRRAKDGGIDGIKYFHDVRTPEAKKILDTWHHGPLYTPAENLPQVIGHEMSHVADYDIRTMMMIAVRNAEPSRMVKTDCRAPASAACRAFSASCTAMPRTMSTAAPKNREVEAAKARARSAQRYAA